MKVKLLAEDLTVPQDFEPEVNWIQAGSSAVSQLPLVRSEEAVLRRSRQIECLVALGSKHCCLADERLSEGLPAAL